MIVREAEISGIAEMLKKWGKKVCMNGTVCDEWQPTDCATNRRHRCEGRSSQSGKGRTWLTKGNCTSRFYLASSDEFTDTTLRIINFTLCSHCKMISGSDFYVSKA
jgi:hypothetical protein